MLFSAIWAIWLWAKGFFGMAFIVCAAISLALLIGELIWYRIKRKRGSRQ